MRQTMPAGRARHRCVEDYYAWVAKHAVEVRHTGTYRGHGVYATVDIPKHTVLGKYVGEVLTRAQLDARYAHKEAVYVLQLGKDRFVDPSDPSKGNWTRYMNDPRGTGRPANIRVGPRGGVSACRGIKAGEELMFSYGSGYHLPPPPDATAALNAPATPPPTTAA